MPLPAGTSDFDVGSSVLAALSPQGIEWAQSFGGSWSVRNATQACKISVADDDLIWVVQQDCVGLSFIRRSSGEIYPMDPDYYGLLHSSYSTFTGRRRLQADSGCTYNCATPPPQGTVACACIPITEPGTHLALVWFWRFIQFLPWPFDEDRLPWFANLCG